MLLQSNIERAMKYTKSNKAAARFLNVHYLTYRKYAKMYFDKDGKSLFEKHYNASGRGINKVRLKKGENIDDILNNLCPNYPLQQLKNMLINNSYVVEKCDLCGFCEKRLTDGKVPLLMSFKDKKNDYSLENLELLCYNCYFLTVGSIMGRTAEHKIQK